MLLTSPQALNPHSKDLGEGMRIARYLPHHELQAIGPFIFFDHMPGLEFPVGKGADVRAHPHIGLSTLSYLLEGRMHHRDSSGCDVILSPGDVLLMTSGHGIAHSERTPAEDRHQPSRLQMLQFWLALPKSHEQMDPAVARATVSELPVSEIQAGLQGRLAIGSFVDMSSPVSSHLNPVLLDLSAETAGSWSFNSPAAELALFVLSGEVSLEDQTYTGPCLVALPRTEQQTISYQAGSRFVLFGGEPLDGRRHLWWNLVASDPALIEAAKLRWKQGEFPLVPGDNEEFIPLPE